MDNSSPDMLPTMQKIYDRYKDDPRIIIDYTKVPVFTMRVVFDMVAYVANKAIFDLGGKEPYIIFTANDVVMHPDKVKTVINIFDSNPNENVICFGASRHYPPEQSASCQLDWTHFIGTRKLMKHVGRICDFRAECPTWWFAPDAWLWTRIANLGHTVTNYKNNVIDKRYETPVPEDQHNWKVWYSLSKEERQRLGQLYIDTYLRKDIVFSVADDGTIEHISRKWNEMMEKSK